MAPKPPKLASRCSQVGPKTPNLASKAAQVGPKIPQVGVQDRPCWPQDAQIGLPEPLRWRLGKHLGAYLGHVKGRVAPGPSQDAPRTLPDHQNGAKMHPSLIKIWTFNLNNQRPEKQREAQEEQAKQSHENQSHDTTIMKKAPKWLTRLVAL